MPAGAEGARSWIRTGRRAATESSIDGLGPSQFHLRHIAFRPANGLMLSRVAAPPSGSATHSVAQNERRKPRASERRYVGSCNELAGPKLLDWIASDFVVYCCQDEAVVDCLANQHAIEWIAMDWR